MSIEKGSMREVVNHIYRILIQDETLMRLLYYYPLDATHPEPLDVKNPNIVDPESEEYWNIVDDRVLLAEKFSDIINKDICRIYITQGRRRPVFGNYLLATQEIIISIYTHENYEKDMRSAWIADRINELIALADIDGMLGDKLEYVAGNPRVAPVHYKRYDTVYEYTTSKASGGR